MGTMWAHTCIKLYDLKLGDLGIIRGIISEHAVAMGTVKNAFQLVTQLVDQKAEKLILAQPLQTRKGAGYMFTANSPPLCVRHRPPLGEILELQSSLMSQNDRVDTLLLPLVGQLLLIFTKVRTVRVNR